MRGLILAIAVSLSAACVTGCAKPLPRLPDSVPLVVAATDADLRAATVKSLEIVGDVGNIVNDASKIRVGLQADGIGSDALHASISSRLIALSNYGLKAIEKIRAGVKTWAELKALIDPLLLEANPLIASIEAAGGSIKARFEGVKDGLFDVLGQAIALFLQPGVPTSAVQPGVVPAGV